MADTRQILIGAVTNAGASPLPVSSVLVSSDSTVAPPIELYFYLHIVEETPANLGGGESKPVLKPGQKICLRVFTDEDAYLPQQELVKIRDEIECVLKCEGLPALGISIANAHFRASREEVSTFQREFEVSIPEDCLRGEIIFKLERIKGSLGRTVASLSCTVAGKKNPIDKQLFQSLKINLNVFPSEQVAFLHIESPSPENFRLKGWNLHADILNDVYELDRKIDLADFSEQEIEQGKPHNILKNESRNLPKTLKAWLQKLHNRFGSNLCLVIADHSNTSFPWEMIEVEWNKPLGAICIMTRWIPVHSSDPDYQFSVAAQQYGGGVLAYLDDQELPEIELERKALKQLNANFQQTTKELCQQLADALHGVGLVYLACHGTFTYNDEHHAAIGLLDQASRSIPLFQLESFHQPSDARPLFFVNACHSARIVQRKKRFYGLPEVMLSQLAHGYIGTLGEIGTSYASYVGEQILTRAHSSPEGINPAEVLRDIRAQAMNRLAQDSSKENRYDFICAFLYVYYGNPLTCLRLTGPDKPKKKKRMTNDD